MKCKVFIDHYCSTPAIMNIITWWGYDHVVDHYAPTKSIIYPNTMPLPLRAATSWASLFEILVTWFSTLVKDTGSIPRILRELYARIANLEFESLEMSEMYQIRS